MILDFNSLQSKIRSESPSKHHPNNDEKLHRSNEIEKFSSADACLAPYHRFEPTTATCMDSPENAQRHLERIEPMDSYVSQSNALSLAGSIIDHYQQALSSTIAGAIIYVPGAALNSAQLDQFRVPEYRDITARGLTANMSRTLLEKVVIDSIQHLLEGVVANLLTTKESTGSEFLIKSGIAATNALVAAYLLCPLERIRQYQLREKTSFSEGFTTLVSAHGYSELFRGANSQALGLVQSMLIRSTASIIGGDNLHEVKSVTQKLSLALSPLRTILAFAGSKQQSNKIPLGAALNETMDEMRNKPYHALAHIIMSMIVYAYLYQSVYFISRHYLNEAATLLHGAQSNQ